MQAFEHIILAKFSDVLFRNYADRKHGVRRFTPIKHEYRLKHL